MTSAELENLVRLDLDEGLVADLIKAAEAVLAALRAADLPPEA